MVIRYSYEYEGDLNVSPHFKVREFASINNNMLLSDDVLIDTDIIDILEALFQYMNAYKIVITSGYRTTAHEKAVGNKSGKGYHTTGNAVDINIWKNKKERYTSKEICLALEDLFWQQGIGIISHTAVHIDSRSNKYYFNEQNGNKSIGTSFYTYYNEKTNREKTKERFGFDEEITMKFLDKHPFSNSLYQKLANGR